MKNLKAARQQESVEVSNDVADLGMGGEAREAYSPLEQAEHS